MVAARFLLPDAPPEPVEARVEAPPQPAPAPNTQTVLAAARELPIGTLLRDEDLTPLEVEKGEVRRGHLVMKGTETIDAMRGHAVREPLAAGAPLTRTAIVGPGQRGFLAAVLTPGTRASTIQLGEGARMAGLIDPGDRVDVILTARLRLANGRENVFSRTILDDVRVVAVDRLVGTRAGTGQDEAKRERKQIVTATLEVLPEQAHLLALAEQEGTLSVVTRPLAGTAGEETRQAPVSLRDVLNLPEPVAPEPPKPVEPPAKAEEPPAPQPTVVRVIRGSKVTEERFGDPAAGPADATRPAAPEVPAGLAVPAPVPK